jgi:hypothetical protein
VPFSGYKSLSKRRNTTHITVEPGEHLTVVGDLHGTPQPLLFPFLSHRQHQ